MITKSIDVNSIIGDDFKKVRKKWKNYLVGAPLECAIRPEIQPLIDCITSQAVKSWSSMNKDKDVTVLFGKKEVESSSDMGMQYINMLNMAKAYGTYGTVLYHDGHLKEDILYALEWLYEHYYGENEIKGCGWRDIGLYNWWDWYVNVPTSLFNTFIILDNQVSKEILNKYFEVFDYIRSVMTVDSPYAKAQRNIYVVTAEAVLKEDVNLMMECLEYFDIMLQPVESGDGIYKDYSFQNHNKAPMEGMYGTAALINRLMAVASILAETKFEVTSEQVYNQFLWLQHTFRPLLHNGVLFNTACGRGPEEGIMRGRFVLLGTLFLIGCFGAEEDQILKKIIWQNVKEEHLPTVIASLDNVYYANRLLDVMNEKKILNIKDGVTLDNSEKYIMGMVRYCTDRVVQHRNKYAVSLAMSSNRISNYECINHNNMRGWYQGDGALYVYTDLTDGVKDEFGEDFFSYANMHRLPGTTEDTQKREAVSIRMSKKYFPSTDFVGGVELQGEYIMAAMDFEAYHFEGEYEAEIKGMEHGGGLPPHNSDLRAKKSWFLFDDEIVALGSDICSTNEEEVNTYIDNRALFLSDNLENNKVVIDGTVYAGNEDWNETAITASWIHIDCFGGYYFPKGGNVVLNVNNSDKKFFELWLSHGVKPNKNTYSYIMLPTKNAKETSAYWKNPDVEIMECTDKIHAVKENKLGILGLIFWVAGTFGEITVDIPCLVMIRKEGQEYRIAVSEPTQKENEVCLTWRRSLKLITGDKRIMVRNIEKQILMKFNFKETKGETLFAVLRT